MAVSDYSIRVADRENPRQWHILDRWQSYSIVQDMLSSADSFSLSLPPTPRNREIIGRGGQRCQIYSYGALQLTGVLDERSDDTSTDATDLQVGGRDVTAVITDSAVPMDRLTITNLTLLDIAERFTEPWRPDYIPRVVADAAAARYVAAGGKVTYGAGRGNWKDQGYYEGDRPMTLWTEGRAAGQYYPNKRFGKSSPEYRGIDQEPLKQFRAEPGERIWEVLERLSRQVACHIWNGPQGELIIARPCYGFDPKLYGAGIELRWDKTAGRAAGGNVKGVHLQTSIAERFSDYSIYAQSKSSRKARGKQVVRHGQTWRDPGQAFWAHTPTAYSTRRYYKQEVLRVRRLNDPKLLTRLARTTVEERVIKGFNLEYMLNGHHAPSGALWVTDSLVNVRDERNNISGPMYITKVERKFDQSGPSTKLRVIPPDIWLAYDHDTTPADWWEAHMAKAVWW